MKNKKILVLIILLLILITGCNTKKETISKTNIINKETSSMIMIINSNEYSIDLEDNKTVNELKDLLPLKLNMQELNGNEKYAYLDKELTTNSYNPKEIKKGDIMLFGNNCLVLFYKGFETTYSYTKIGHINNLEDLDSNNIKVEIVKG